MSPLFLMVSALAGATASPHLSAPDYPSCDLRAQHRVTGDVGGRIHTPVEAHVSVRANILEADLSTARKARLLTEARATALFAKVEAVRRDAARRGRSRISDRAAFDRRLDAVARQLCEA